MRLDNKANKQTTLQKVTKMANNNRATTLAGEFGLSIQNVSWEDCARTKQSSWGPCISDMTLQVEKTPLPVVRLPNFTDVSWDQPLKNIPLNVGNEQGKDLQQISLYEYLENISQYLHTPGSIKSLIAPERDSHAIMTSQACFLPVAEGTDTKFNVCLKNYQSSPNNPAVLVIVASSSGTSAQVIDTRTAQTLYFNKNGEKASFMAKRLKDQRRERGEPIEGEMTSEEKADNMILVIQVPLKQRQRHVPHSPIYPVPLPHPFPNQPHYPYYGPLDSHLMNYPQQMPFQQSMPQAYGMPMKESACNSMFAQPCMATSNCQPRRKRVQQMQPEACDVDQAMISVGDGEGRFSELKGLSIERDNRYPVRVTLQYYKATSNGEVNESVIEEIAVQMITARSFAEHNEIGSLVTDRNVSNRTTESVPQVSSWWSAFWMKHHAEFPDFSENMAKKHVLAAGNPSQADALAILRKHKHPRKPVWDPSAPM